MPKLDRNIAARGRREDSRSFRVPNVSRNRSARDSSEALPCGGTESRDRDAAAPLVCVIDDDVAMREALGTLLESAGYDTKLYPSPGEFLAEGRAGALSCLILDVRLRAESGLDFQEWLIDRGLDIPIILMTGHGDIPMTVRAMKQGAVDFLAKPFRDDDMLSAIATAIRIGTRHREDAVRAADIAARYQTLSQREREVMELVVAGLMNKQAAAEIGLAEITVKIHRGRMMRKMRAASVPDLVRMYELLTSGGVRYRAG